MNIVMYILIIVESGVLVFILKVLSNIINVIDDVIDDCEENAKCQCNFNSEVIKLLKQYDKHTETLITKKIMEYKFGRE